MYYSPQWGNNKDLVLDTCETRKINKFLVTSRNMFRRCKLFQTQFHECSDVLCDLTSTKIWYKGQTPAVLGTSQNKTLFYWAFI